MNMLGFHLLTSKDCDQRISMTVKLLRKDLIFLIPQPNLRLFVQNGSGISHLNIGEHFNVPFLTQNLYELSMEDTKTIEA